MLNVTWWPLGDPDILDSSKWVEGILQLISSGVVTEIADVNLRIQLHTKIYHMDMEIKDMM